VLFQIPIPGNPRCLDGVELPKCFQGVVVADNTGADRADLADDVFFAPAQAGVA
jgi:hypothetical protein